MQSFNLLYKNEYYIYLADNGWCLLSNKNTLPQKSVLEEGTCLFFFPTNFVPDRDFCINAEQFYARTKAKLVWIENPNECFSFWRCTVSALSSSLYVGIGGCNIILQKPRNEDSRHIVFDGAFTSCSNLHNFPISDGGVILNLKKSTGELSFTFCCDKSTDLFAAINAGIKYVMPLPHDTEKGYERNFTASFYNSVLISDTELSMFASISPCLLQDCDLTYILLPKTTFKSSFLSSNGCPIELTSLNAKLVLESAASTVSYDEQDETNSYGGLSWYWGIAGNFSLPHNTNSGALMMLGLSGTEFIRADNEVELMFVSHQNALVNNLDGNGSKDNLNLPVVTAPWISFKGAYHSSSESMPLFTSDSGHQSAPENSSSYLRPFIPAVATFSDFSPAFPLIPWKNTGTVNPCEAIIMENYLYQNRFGLLSGLMRQSSEKFIFSDTADNSITALAPCGLCANVNQVTSNWNWIGIAQTSNDNLPDIRLYSLSPHTRAMLQNKECVLIVSTIEEFNELGTEEEIICLPVDGWEIVLSDEYWKKDKTLMLMKYSKASAIREILSGSTQFEYVLSLACTGEGKLKPEYAELMDIIDDVNFQGILILGAAALATNVPAEVKAITSDIKNGEIAAVYTIIHRSRAEVDNNGQISVAKSAVSSVFSFKGESIMNDKHAEVKLDFRTVGINAVIKQSKLKQFSSRSELFVAELFGSTITPSNLGGGSCLILNGILETISGTAVYKFSLAHSLEFSSPNTPISKIIFDDLRMIGGDNSIDFTLAGKLSLIETDACDIFSYATLPFTGVKIVKKGSKMDADYSLSAFSQETSSPRSGSFADAFGAKITEVILCKSDKTPDDIAFSSIMTPVKQGTLDKMWSGIVWKVSLGSSGELDASNELAFEIITAWSNQKYYIGLRLPGVLNKNFSLQGLFSAGFSGVDLQQNDENVLYFRLHGFTLKLLGISIPKKGAELLILGEQGKIAWYMGYEDEKEKM